MTPSEMLELPMDPDANDASASTVRDYLIALLERLWEEGEGFSGKRPFGNSAWDWELYVPFARAGLIDAEWSADEEYLENVDDKAGHKLVVDCILALGLPPDPRCASGSGGTTTPS